MGTNYYIDQGEGDDYLSYPHIGKTTTLLHNMTFIFFKSREYQMSLIESMKTNIVNEYGERINIQEFLRKVEHLPYLEQEFVFF